MAFLAGLCLAASCEPAPIAGRDYRLAYEENFNGTTLSPQWATAAYGGSLQPTVANGSMTVRTTAANNRHWGYVASTGQRSAVEPNYPRMAAWEEGYFEARLRYTDSNWAWPAFWLYSASTTEAWPNENCAFYTAEWDIMENGIANWNGERPARHSNVSVAHYNTRDNSADGYCGVADETRLFIRDFPSTDLSGWRTWGGRWEGDELCTYLDNVRIQCMQGFDTMAQPLHMAFTMQYLRKCPGCGTRPAAMQMQVDWVRVWQR